MLGRGRTIQLPAPEADFGDAVRQSREGRTGMRDGVRKTPPEDRYKPFGRAEGEPRGQRPKAENRPEGGAAGDAISRRLIAGAE